MSTSTGVPEAVVGEFDRDLFDFTGKYLDKLSAFQAKHDLSDEDIAALLRERFGDMEDVWFEFVYEEDR